MKNTPKYIHAIRGQQGVDCLLDKLKKNLEKTCKQ